MSERRSVVPLALGVLGIVFGLLTLKEGSAVLFFDGAARRAAGHYVPFVVWFNVIVALVYLAAGVSLVRRRPIGVRLAKAIAVATVLVLVAFGVHVARGGAWEPRTLGALSLRIVVWALIAVVGARQLGVSSARRRSGEIP